MKSRSSHGGDDNAEDAEEEEEEEEEEVEDDEEYDADVPDAVVIRVKGKIVSGTGKVYPTGLSPYPLLLGRAWQILIATPSYIYKTLVTLSQIASHDVASIICQALPPPRQIMPSTPSSTFQTLVT